MEEYWEVEINTLQNRYDNGDDVFVDLEAAKRMADPTFAGDYEMAIDSVLMVEMLENLDLESLAEVLGDS